MRRPLYRLLVLSLAFSLSCKKQASGIPVQPNSALTVVNAVINTDAVIAGFDNPDSAVYTYFFTTPTVAFGSFTEYSLPSGATPLELYDVSDTSHTLLSANLQLQASGIYSLFLCGVYNQQNQVDTLFVHDTPPYHRATDSTVGIRFVNLSPGTNAISVNIQSGQPASTVADLPYKGITSFQLFPASIYAPPYTFEFRDGASDSLLATYTYPASPFQNITLALIGSENMAYSSPLSVVQINNF